MTSLLELHPDAGHPALGGAAAIHEVLDGVDVSVPLESVDYAHAVAEWERAIRRIEAIKLRLVAEAERARAAALSGLPSTAAWLARHTRSDQASATRTAKLAGRLFDDASGASPTATALGDGTISTEHARVITQATSTLPPHLSSEHVATVEASLVDRAKTCDPVALRKAARRALAAVEPDPEAVDAHHDQVLRDEEARARAKARLTLHDNADGTLTGHFTVPVVAGRILQKVLDAMTAPRRGPLGASYAQAGEQGADRDWAHDRGLAFAELLEHLPTDHLHGKVAAQVIVTLDLHSLLDGVRVAGCDTGDEITAGQARRLACNAGLVPAVLGTGSVPLDLGHTKRLFSEGQRMALATRHSTCAAEGCQRPFSWCELHHRQPWRRRGPTDLANAEPLCSFHHHRIHDPGYHHSRGPDGRVRFTRRT